MKKTLRKMMWFMVCLSMMLMLFQPFSMSVHAAAGKMIIDMSASTLSIGDELTVYVTAHNNEGVSTTTDMKITFDEAVLEYNSSNAASAVCSGQTITATGKSIQLHFTAKGEGTTNIIAYGTNEEGTLTAAGVKIKVAAGESNSQTGNEGNTQEPTEDPAEGTNNEDPNETGTPEEPGEITQPEEILFMIDGVSYYVSTDFDTRMLAQGFAEVDVEVQSQTTKALQYEDKNWFVLYLISKADDTVNGYYLFDPESGDICPYLGSALEDGVDEQTAADLESVQKNYKKLYDKYQKLQSNNRKMMVGIIVAIVALLLILINVLIFRSINRRDEEDDFDEQDEHFKSVSNEFNEKNFIEKQGAYLEASASNSAKKEKHHKVQEDVDLAAEVNDIMKQQKDSLEIIDLEDL